MSALGVQEKSPVSGRMVQASVLYSLKRRAGIHGARNLRNTAPRLRGTIPSGTARKVIMTADSLFSHKVKTPTGAQDG